MTISKDAIRALMDLEHGARFNCIHSIARELIDEGYAFDGWGRLEITEMGRRAARTFRSFTANDARIAELHPERTDLAFETPADSHPLPEPDPITDRSADVPSVKLNRFSQQLPEDEPAVLFIEGKRGGEMLELPADGAAPVLPWSRDRAMRAAGVANGAQEIWVGSSWVRAFMDAYEAIE